MLKRILSALMVAALACATSVVNASAQDVAAGRVQSAAKTSAAGTSGARSPGAGAGADLKADMLKLVAEARAGRAGQTPPPQRQPAQSNGLSKGRKVAIGGGAVAAVIILVIILSRGDNSDGFVAPPCPPGQLCL